MPNFTANSGLLCKLNLDLPCFAALTLCIDIAEKNQNY